MRYRRLRGEPADVDTDLSYIVYWEGTPLASSRWETRRVITPLYSKERNLIEKSTHQTPPKDRSDASGATDEEPVVMTEALDEEDTDPNLKKAASKEKKVD